MAPSTSAETHTAGQAPTMVVAAVILALGVALTKLAIAAPVVDQPPLDGGEAFGSFRDVQSADDFSWTEGGQLAAAQWWGVYLVEPDETGQPDAFSVRFFANAGGLPEAEPFASFAQPSLQLTRTPTDLVDAAGARTFAYEATLPSSLMLDAGTPYYLSIVNSFEGQNAQWFWQQSDPIGVNYFRSGGDASSWSADASGDLAFALTPVPLPATAVPFLLALAALGFATRSRRDVL